jgi:4-hydroxysphinganine ceramide fatty acyl 2-hydroxylase
MLLVFLRHGAVALLGLGVAALLVAGIGGVTTLSAVEIVLGAILFYLSEYGMRRFAFHAPPAPWPFVRSLQRRLHHDHHVEPSRLDPLFLPLWFLAPNLAATAVLVALALGTPAVASVMLGVMLAIPRDEARRRESYIPDARADDSCLTRERRTILARGTPNRAGGQ